MINLFKILSGEGSIKMYIAICDDEKQYIDELIKAIESWQKSNNFSVRYKTFSNASELVDCAKKEHFSLYILDVLMPGINGLEAAKDIRNFDEAANIIFLTSTTGFAYDSYGVKALEYMLKPVNEDLLIPILNRLYLKEQKPLEGLTIKSGSSIVRILFSQLVYVEVKGKHLYFNLTDGTVREVFGTLKEYEPILLKRPEFMQVHRSYIVNMLQAEELSHTGVHTFNGKLIPVSRKLYPDLQNNYLKLLFSEREEI